MTHRTPANAPANTRAKNVNLEAAPAVGQKARINADAAFKDQANNSPAATGTLQITAGDMAAGANVNTNNQGVMSV